MARKISLSNANSETLHQEMEIFRILIINPGSTSTKIAIFENDQQMMEKVLYHSTEKISQYSHIIQQYEFRMQEIINELQKNKIELSSLSAIVGRGGLLKPLQSGTYLISKTMVEELHLGRYGEHASNLGAIIASELANKLKIPAYIVDPVVVDEMEPLARISGMPEIQRKSIFHALNQKAVARKAAAELNRNYDNCNFIVAHLGGGISVGAHLQGRVVDVNNALDGEGPFSPERTGGLPIGDLVELCFSGKVTHEELKRKINGQGGLAAYLQTNDGRVVEKLIKEDNQEAKLIYQAMAYQVAKEIGMCATVLKGKVDAIIITGGLAHDASFVGWIDERVSFIAKIIVYPGEDEMSALAMGGLSVLKGEASLKAY